MDRSTRQKIIRETFALSDILGQTDLIGIYGIVHPKAKEYIIFSSAHETLSRIDHTQATKQVLINLRRLKLYQVPFLPQRYEVAARNQYRKKKKKQINQYVDIKQHDINHPVIQ